MQMINGVLITGSSRGLGEEMAMNFASHGHNLIIHGRDVADLDRVRKRILEKFDADVYAVVGDLRDKYTLNSLESAAINASVLINNAAIHSHPSRVEEMTDAEIDDTISVNLTAPIKLMRRIYPIFLNRGYGTIININSILGLESRETKGLYVSSKYGLRGFSSCLRRESLPHNVKIIDVYPSRIKTKPEFDYGMTPEEVAERIYQAYTAGQSTSLILDNRPQEFRQEHNIE
jgi:uncharacterized protein